MRIAITGHKGQLGQSLQHEFRQDKVLGLDLPEYDITDARTITEAIFDF